MTQSNKPLSPLRQRMLEDMRIRNPKKARDVLNIKPPETEPVADDESKDEHLICKHCAGAMQVIEVLEGTLRARAPPLLATA